MNRDDGKTGSHDERTPRDEASLPSHGSPAQALQPRWIAIVAMAENRVIGSGNRIPWHLPEDFRWFKQVTMGHTLVMGRRTFESIGRPLPGRRTIVLTGTTFTHPGVLTASSLDELPNLAPQGDLFICGGAQVYQQALPRCLELLLTRLKRSIDGDAFFPPFEHLFDRAEVIRDTPEFTIERWRGRTSGGSRILAVSPP